MDRYFEAGGGRKTATAMVRLFNKKGSILVNGKDYMEYFRSSPKNQLVVRSPLESVSLLGSHSASALVNGGGLNAQAEAIRNALSKALVSSNDVFKKNLRQAGFLTRDPRMVERKKYGLKKARRAPQWAKR